MILEQGNKEYLYEFLIKEEVYDTENQSFLVKAEEAIHRLVSLKARITTDLARQVAEAPGKKMGAKKRKSFLDLPRKVQSRHRSGPVLTVEDLW